MRKAPCAAEPSCPCIHPQDVDACVNQGIVWSLEESGDGWDDVRAAVIEAKKERVKALDTIKEKYGPGVSAAAKWAKVIAGEVGGALPTEGIKLDKGIKLDIKVRAWASHPFYRLFSTLVPQQLLAPSPPLRSVEIERFPMQEKCNSPPVISR